MWTSTLCPNSKGRIRRSRLSPKPFSVATATGSWLMRRPSVGPIAVATSETSSAGSLTRIEITVNESDVARASYFQEYVAGAFGKRRLTSG